MRQKGNNATVLPLLATFSLLTGFTLTGLVLQAVAVAGSASIGIAALATAYVARSLLYRCADSYLGSLQQLAKELLDENKRLKTLAGELAVR